MARLGPVLAINAKAFVAASAGMAAAALWPKLSLQGEFGLLLYGYFGAASALAGACDVVLTVGTSLDVSTGMWVVMQAMESGARLVVVNRGPSQADRLADLVVDGGADDVLPGLAAVLLGDAP